MSKYADTGDSFPDCPMCRVLHVASQTRLWLLRIKVQEGGIEG